MNFFQRQAIGFNNDAARSTAALVGIVQGVLSDGQINDDEVAFLRSWLQQNSSVSATWPGNVLAARIEAALADGHISADERAHLLGTLQALVGGTLQELAESSHVSTLALDNVEGIEVQARTFCLSGDFAFGPRERCGAVIVQAGGLISASVTKKLDYLVVGGLGSPEWKHGSFGTKIAKAMQYKAAGARLLVVHEDVWAASLFARS